MVYDASKFQLVRYSSKQDVEQALYDWYNQHLNPVKEQGAWYPIAYYTVTHLQFNNTLYLILQERVANSFTGAIFEVVETQDVLNFKVKPFGEIKMGKWVGGTLQEEDPKKTEIVGQLKEWVDANENILAELGKTHLSSRNWWDEDSDSSDDEADGAKNENENKETTSETTTTTTTSETTNESKPKEAAKETKPTFEQPEDEGLHDAVEDLLQRVAGMLTVTPASIRIFATLLKYVTKRLAGEITKLNEKGKDKEIKVEDIVLAFGNMCPTELADYGKSAIEEDVGRYRDDAMKWKTTILSLTEADAEYLLRNYFPITGEVAFAFAAGVEFIISEVLESATGLAIKHNSYLVTDYYVKKTIITDKELTEFFTELLDQFQVTDPDPKLVESNPKLMGTGNQNIEVV